MTEINQNTELWTGDDIQIPFVIIDEYGRPRDITGAAFTYSVRDKPGGTLLFTPAKTVGSGITIDIAASGTGHIVVDSADTAAVSIIGEHQDFYQELEMVLASRTYTCWTGRFRLHKSVSGAGA